MPDSRIPADLIAAYRETHYRVFAPSPFTLYIDHKSEPLADLQRARNVACSAFLTAWNPHSRSTSESENNRRQEEFCADLRRQNLAFIEGLGEHPSNGWGGEPSLLVLGLQRVQAEELGRSFEQNGIVWAGSECVPRLILFC